MTELLTLSSLKLINEESIFRSGVTNDMRLYHEAVSWVAVKGSGNNDWAIYYHHANFSNDEIAQIGEKVAIEAIIKKLVPCDDEAFKQYRY